MSHGIPKARFALSEFADLDLDAHLETSSLDPWPSLSRLLDRAFHQVPAYRHYLEGFGHTAGVPESLEAFGQLPLMTKKDYIQAYALDARVEGGDLSALDRLAVSSGSTGTPTFWPRAEAHEFPIAVRFEQVFRDSFRAHEKKTLAVVCFALGNWVGGFFTASCCWHLARKGYPLTVATPGNNLAEILRVINALGSSYDQVVLLGYPPFVRDVVDQGRAQGIDWGRLRTRMVFAGEVFSEEWRRDIVRRAGGSAPHLETASLYGTADGGVLGNETPYSNLIRATLAQKPEAARALFGESRLPTLVQ
ncbi:MAG: phenylacetate--CoA ligase, partial [Phenylobacterium zucineum]